MQPDAVLQQRRLTVEFLARRRLTAPAIWLKTDDTLAESVDTRTEQWLTEEGEDRLLGVRLVDGFVELSIKAADEAWTACFFRACHTLRIDARAAYGQIGGPPHGVILKIDDQASIEPWKNLWPRGWKDRNDRWTETAIVYSTPAEGKKARAVWRHSKPLPGSILSNALIVWRPMGREPALDMDDLEPRALAPTSLPMVVRALAWATLSHWVLVALDGLDWTESLTRTVGGWMAREVLEGQAVNARGKSLEGVCWAPVDTIDHADELLTFLDGPPGLKLAMRHAELQLERDPLAPVPGWPALGTELTQRARQAIRRAFRAGLDVTRIEALAERYVFDTETQTYVDLDSLLSGTATYEYKAGELEQRHDNEAIFVGQKAHNPFKLYARSSLRVDVASSDMLPGETPGAILRYSPVHGVIRGDSAPSDEIRLLNIYRGVLIKEAAMVDPAVMAEALKYLDLLLGLLTQDNPDQALWLKKFIAWTLQYPAEKQQVAPILIGGQGIGKSLFGNVLMRALFGNLAGLMTAAAMADNRYLVTPFIGKLITFVDETRFDSKVAVNEIKNLIRSVQVSGEMKFGHRASFNVYSRVIMASNSADIGLSPEDAADRAFFFVKGWTAEGRRMTAREFLDWTVRQKPFYDAFIQTMARVDIRQHLMSYFLHLECTRAELEDLTLSSRNDADVVEATMSEAARMARAIVADATIRPGVDIIAWFSAADLQARILARDKRSRLRADEVLREYERAQVVERQRSYYRFRYRYGTLLEKLGGATNLRLDAGWDMRPDDWGENTVLSAVYRPPWRGRDKPRDEAKRAPDPDDEEIF